MLLLPGGTGVQGDPLPRDPQGAVSPSGGTVVQGDPLPRDPRRSLVELRVLSLPAIILLLAIFELGLTLLTSSAIVFINIATASDIDILPFSAIILTAIFELGLTLLASPAIIELTLPVAPKIKLPVII